MADKDSRNEALVLQTSATEVRIIANRKGHSIILVFWLPGLETARRLTRRKLFVSSVRSCHHTLGTRLTSPPNLSTIIQWSILLSWRSLAEEPVPAPVVVVHLRKRHFRPLSLNRSAYQRLVAITRSW